MQGVSQDLGGGFRFTRVAIWWGDKGDRPYGAVVIREGSVAMPLFRFFWHRKLIDFQNVLTGN